ncbi:MAG: hypothetical protein P1P93_11610 [Gammaproteobacteria bacterium]|nr:hypothetical protein [Gammaproteobacteria bacterium]
MKYITLLSVGTLLLSSCATIKPLSITGPSGKQGFSMDCVSGTPACFSKAGQLCPNGYDIIDHSITSSIVITHYGAYPMNVTRESLTIECK